jgi:hypothetical protein
VLGELERFWIPVSNYQVTPVLALAERRPILEASPDEVANILTPRVAAFLPGAPMEIVERTIRDWPIRYGAFRVDGLSVWGATARVLSQLGAMLVYGPARRRTRGVASGTCGIRSAGPAHVGREPMAPCREVARCARCSVPWPSSP